MIYIFHFLLLTVAITLIAPNHPLQTAFAFSLLGYLAVLKLIPRVSDSFIKIGLKGKDLSKPHQPTLPETMGLVSAITYLILMIFLIPFVFFKYLVSFTNDDALTSSTYQKQFAAISDNNLFPHNKLAEYLSAILCLQSTTLLGLFDDLFDIRWRHKFFLPAIASLPLLIVYYVDFSVTSVVIPPFLMKGWGSQIFLVINFFIDGVNRMVEGLSGLKFMTRESTLITSPPLLDLGIFYYIYMSAISIFSPNSINILAGINGLEVGQSIILAVILLLNDFCYLVSTSISQAAHDSHLFSAIFLIPFIGVSVALLQYNWWPARCFVGDTYCYFSGMVFAIVGICGHFSKTLLIFLLPQIINFVYGLPQLFHVVPCPRHRMPRFNKTDGLMYPSYGSLDKPNKVSSGLLTILSTLRLVDLQQEEGENKTTTLRFSNLTIINLTLVWLGPLREDTLCLVILVAQLLIGVSMIALRHTVGPWLFGYDNLSWGVK
ncbi:UDP-N-acetylglucosamine--dolichyl-phosphate N-acetylglucosaminephosphotransferase [[Candida] anglica]|uniref:UDP-N-acetylglucosamine--dolichyl-phosphate N-acetylglucosaminephosphotransferase n=1 Tax=[Candida] anglica TaxID=148631 RepID=A0ABP0E8D0_9ASCO